ncbi:MAG: hypothetical protein KAJ19_08745, partial [Gammaproteobacteria bacterium]|nr:hypothetical protein [Gammaproteobacteria bacterium]
LVEFFISSIPEHNDENDIVDLILAIAWNPVTVMFEKYQRPNFSYEMRLPLPNYIELIFIRRNQCNT